MPPHIPEYDESESFDAFNFERASILQFSSFEKEVGYETSIFNQTVTTDLEPNIYNSNEVDETNIEINDNAQEINKIFDDTNIVDYSDLDFITIFPENQINQMHSQVNDSINNSSFNVPLENAIINEISLFYNQPVITDLEPYIYKPNELNETIVGININKIFEETIIGDDSGLNVSKILHKNEINQIYFGTEGRKSKKMKTIEEIKSRNKEPIRFGNTIVEKGSEKYHKLRRNNRISVEKSRQKQKLIQDQKDKEIQNLKSLVSELLKIIESNGIKVEIMQS